MHRFLITLLTVIILAGCGEPSQAAVYVFAPGTSSVYTIKTDIVAFEAAADCVGKVGVISSPVTLTTAVTHKADRGLQIIKGGLITTSGAGSLTFADGASIDMGDGSYQVFAGTKNIKNLSAATPDMFGVTGTNDEVAIQKCFDSSDSTLVKFLPGKTYYIDEQVFFGPNRVEGNGAVIQVHANSSFIGSLLPYATRTSATGVAASTAAIYTKSALGGPYASTYPTQELYINNLTIRMDRTSASAVSTPFVIENVTRGIIDNYTDTATAATAASNLPVNGLDLFANNSNIVIKNSHFSYMANPSGTMTSPQGGMWVRAYGTAASGTVTGNITIQNCDFYSNQKDEPFAVFTNVNTIDGVEVNNCRFTVYDNYATTGRSRLITATTTSTGTVKNTTFRDCTFTTSGTADVGIAFNAQPGQNNNIYNSIFNINLKHTAGDANPIVVYGVSSIIGKTINILSISDTGHTYRGVSTADMVSDVKVNFSAACYTTTSNDIIYLRPFDTCKTVKSNIANGVVYNSQLVDGNQITGAFLSCVRVINNIVTPDADKRIFGAEDISANKIYDISNNFITDTIITSPANSNIFNLTDTDAVYYINNNHYEGYRTSWGEPYASGQVVSFENNVLAVTGGATTNSSYVSSGLSAPYQYASGFQLAPIGHIVRNTNNATDSTIWGWMKIANDGTSIGDWRTLAP